MLVFYYRENYPHSINFNIYSLITTPYSTLKKPYAELYKKGNTTEKTLDINDAEVDAHGWVTFGGEIFIDAPAWQTFENKISTSWRDVEIFTTEFKAIVKRTIYEAIEINSQIAEESNHDQIDFDKENPYLETNDNNTKENDNNKKEKPKDSWRFIILVILLYIVWKLIN